MKEKIIQLEKEITEKISSFNDEFGLDVDSLELIYIYNNLTDGKKIVSTKIKI